MNVTSLFWGHNGVLIFVEDKIEKGASPLSRGEIKAEVFEAGNWGGYLLPPLSL